MIDIAIIGGGPAAFSAAITARQRNKTVAVYKAFSEKGWLYKAEKINNYPGLFGMSGRDMLNLFERQSEDMGAQIQTGMVRQIMKADHGFMLLIQNEVVEARVVILSIGAAQPKILDNEEALLGKGVSYCGTCDGMFYKGKRVAVLAYSNQALAEAHFLSSLAEKVVYITPNPDLAKGLNQNIPVILEKPVRIIGEDRVEGVATENRVIPVHGVFVFRDAVTYNTLISGVRLEHQFIQVSRYMETNIEGLYAAGDCTGKPFQIAKAVGEGNVAAIAAAEFLDRRPDEA